MPIVYPQKECLFLSEATFIISCSCFSFIMVAMSYFVKSLVNKSENIGRLPNLV